MSLTYSLKVENSFTFRENILKVILYFTKIPLIVSFYSGIHSKKRLCHQFYGESEQI